MKFTKDNIIKYGETLIIGDLLRLEEDQDGRVLIRAVSSGVGGINLDDLGDVVISSPVVEQFLGYNGSSWVNTIINSGVLPSNGNYLRLDGSTPMAGNINMQNYQITWSASVGTGLDLNNSNITGVNSLFFADPGTSEGLVWLGGSGWRIYESPNDLSNFAGNLQIVLSGTRIATFGINNSFSVQGSAQFNADLGDGYVRIDGDVSVADRGGILLDNSSSAARHMKMTSTFTGSPGTSSRFRMGWVNSGDTETFINGAALEIGPAYQIKLFASGTGSLVVGLDPGNTETVRIGGTVRIGNNSANVTGSGLVLANTSASASNITMYTGGRIDMVFFDSAAALDTKRWDISVDGVGGAGTFSFVSRQDDGTSATQWLRALRTAQIVTQVQVTASGTVAILDTLSWRPGTTGTVGLGLSTHRWDKLWGEDADFSEGVVVSGTFSASGGTLLANANGQVVIGGSLAELQLSPRTGIGSRWELYCQTPASFRLYHAADQYIFSDTEFTPSAAGGKTLGTATTPWGAAFYNNNLRIDHATRSILELYNGGTRRASIDSTSASLIRFVDAADTTVGFQFAIGAAARIIPGATSLSLRNNADSANNLLLSDAGLVTLRNDLVIGSLGTFDSTYTPAVDNILIFSGTKWIPRYFQPNFTTGQVVATNLGDGTSATYVNDGRTPAGSPTAPTGVQDPVATAHYRAIIIDMSAYGALPVDKVFVLDYSINGAAYSTNAIISTSSKVVHSNLDPVKTYTYKYKIRGASDSAYSDPSNTVSPSNNSEVNAFGVVIASQIAAANLSSISANIGDISAGMVRNPANTVGILFSGTLPGSWTTYLNLVATGANPLLHHQGLDLLANGSAIFSGTVTAGYLTIGSGTVNSNLFINNNLTVNNTIESLSGPIKTGFAGFTITPPTGLPWTIVPANPVALSYGLSIFNDTAEVVDIGGSIYAGVYANTGFAAGTNFVPRSFLIHSGVSINSGTIGCGGDIWNPLIVFSGSGTQMVDYRRGNVQKLILKATGQTVKLAKGNIGGVYTLLLFQDAVGSRTVTSWISDDANTDVQWAGGTAPTLSTGGNKVDIITFVKVKGSSATDHYLGVVGGLNYSG